jgi:hypothetical protein
MFIPHLIPFRNKKKRRARGEDQQKLQNKNKSRPVQK